MLLGIVFGSQNLLSQNNPSSRPPLISPGAKVILPTDTVPVAKEEAPSIDLIPLPAIADTVDIGRIVRVIYKNNPGVFLTNEQELITLAKFQWKEIYKLQAYELKFENYKLKIDLNDSNSERDRYKFELEKSQSDQLGMKRSLENAKSMLDQKTKENAVNESLKNQYKKESRIYKVFTYVLAGTIVYLVVR